MCTRPISSITAFIRTRLYSARPSFNPSQSFKLTEPPNPNWKLGQGLSDQGVRAKTWKADEELGWKTWNLTQLEPRYGHPVNQLVVLYIVTCHYREVYPLLTSAVVPRPIAFVSTLCSNGIRNLAPMR
jgi:hypothetical protein